MTLTPLQFSEFSSGSKKQWQRAANAQLRTDNAENELVWNLTSDWKLPAYFDETDEKNLAYLPKHFSQKKFDWQLFKTIDVEDEVSANKAALECLNQGCTGILFHCISEVDLHTLTSNIHYQHCFISFLVPDKFMSETLAFMSENMVQGFCQPAQENSELPDILLEYSRNRTLKSVVLNVGGNFFFEIARLRALRYLIDRVRSNQEIQNPDIWIHAEIVADASESKNLLVQSSAGLAAVIGGANSVSFNADQGHIRIATNVGNLIRDEAKIQTFHDASGGSYFIDFITDQMIQKVWAQFQNMQS